jgi:hypothetical protein
MPSLVNVVPKYRRHKASGQAMVTLNGVDHYLGSHGTKASKLTYDRLIIEWMANGRQLRVGANAGLSVAELIERYRHHVIAHYVEDGRPTTEQHGIASAMRPLRNLYGNTAVSDFGPLPMLWKP